MCPSSHLSPVHAPPLCSYEAGSDAHVLFSVGVAPRSPECVGVMERLSQRGYPTADISDIELAQVGLWDVEGLASCWEHVCSCALVRQRC